MSVRKRSLSAEIIHHLMDTEYSRENLIARDGYTPDTVEHLIRYHFMYLLLARDKCDLDALAIYTDLVGAINRLPDAQKRVINLITAGFSLTDINRELHTVSSRVAKSAYKEIARLLNEGKPS